MSSNELPDLDAVARIVRAAGEVVMSVYAGTIDVRRKDDASPVTEADERAEALIVPALLRQDRHELPAARRTELDKFGAAARTVAASTSGGNATVRWVG